MPVYEYRCQDCHAPFELTRPMSESASTRDVRCPACGSEHVERKYSTVFAKTSKKS